MVPNRMALQRSKLMYAARIKVHMFLWYAMTLQWSKIRSYNTPIGALHWYVKRAFWIDEK